MGSLIPEGAVKPSSIEVELYDKDIIASRCTEIPSNIQRRCDYVSRTDGQPVYVGYAPKGLATDAVGWMIQKYTYDSDDQETLRQTSYTSWDLRADGETQYE